LEGINSSRLSVVWVPEHRGGHLWLHHTDGPLYQLNVEEDNPEIVQQIQLHDGGNRWGIDHDGENLWYAVNDRWICFDDGVAEFHMLELDLEEGIIPANESVDVNILVQTEDIEPGIFNIMMELKLIGVEDVDPTLVEFSAVISVGEPALNLSGTVTDLASERIVEEVQVDLDQYRITRFTDREGVYIFTDLPPNNYELTFTAPDFLPLTIDFELGEEDMDDADIALLHSTCLPDPPQVITEIAPDSDMQMNLNIENDGNGPLTYSIDRRLLGDANAEPWELRVSHNIGAELEDNRIEGVIFVNDNFYVSGENDDEPAIYIFDHDGNYVDLFLQPNEGGGRMRDLAWDGTLLWGADQDFIYGFTLEGEVIHQFESPFSPTGPIVWDPENQWLWVASTTTAIKALDINGDEQAEIPRTGLRKYGLAYYPSDPDGCPLYLFHYLENQQTVSKWDTEAEAWVFVRTLTPEGGGSCGGAFITNTYDIYSWVFMTIANNGADDRIDIWQLDARKDWMQIEPTAGVIEAGETQEFTVTLDAAGLPAEMFRGEFVVTHDGVGGETSIPITLSVVEGPVHTSLTLDMDRGWNLVSIYLTPDNPEFPGVVQPIIDNGSLIMVKDGGGNFMNVEYEFSNLDPWDVAQGYYVKMDEASELAIEGVTVVSDEPIALDQGWANIAYFMRSPINAMVALSSIVEVLDIAKDGTGNFYSPEWNFNGIGNMMPLKGYQVKTTEATELVYRMQMPDDGLASIIPATPARAGTLPRHANTGVNMSLLVIADDFNDAEIGVYANGELIGSGVVTDGRCGFALWGDDPSTEFVDGATDGVIYEVKVLNVGDLADATFNVLRGDGMFKADDFEVIELSGVVSLPTEFGIQTAYPNPFNGRTSIDFSLTEACQVELALFDLSGRQVMEIGGGMLSAGNHTMTLNADDLSSGVYIVNLSANGMSSRVKVTLMK